MSERSKEQREPIEALALEAWEDGARMRPGAEVSGAARALVAHRIRMRLAAILDAPAQDDARTVEVTATVRVYSNGRSRGGGDALGGVSRPSTTAQRWNCCAQSSNV